MTLLPEVVAVVDEASKTPGAPPMSPAVRCGEPAEATDGWTTTARTGSTVGCPDDPPQTNASPMSRTARMLPNAMMVCRSRFPRRNWPIGGGVITHYITPKAAKTVRPTCARSTCSWPRLTRTGASARPEAAPLRRRSPATGPPDLGLYPIWSAEFQPYLARPATE